MPNYRIQHIFNAGRAGWSETYYLNATQTTPQAVYSNNTDFGNLIIRRAQLLSGDNGAPVGNTTPIPRLEGFRIAQLRSPTDPPNTLEPEYGGSTGVAMTANDNNPFRMGREAAVVIRMQTVNNTARRMLMLRGLPEDWLDLAMSDRKTAKLRTALGTQAVRSFLNALVDPKTGASNFLMRRNKRTNPGDVGVNSIERQAMTDRLILHMDAGHGFRVNDKVALRGFRKFNIKGLTGTTRVYNVIGPDVYLYRRACDGCMVPGQIYYTPDATAWRVDVAYENLALAEVSGWGTKKAGRAFFVAAGRRPNKQRCC